MARLVLGLGASHTPLLALDAAQWEQRAKADYANAALNMPDGRLLPYAQVLAELGPRAADRIAIETLDAKQHACQAALDRMADALAAAAVDAVVIVGDDQRELFGAANQPALALFHGEEIVMGDRYGGDEHPDWMQQIGRGYLMDRRHVVPGAPAFALDLVRSLIDQEFDVAACAHVEPAGGAGSAGFGHAYGFIVQRLFAGRAIPVVPLLLNTYYPPNVPSPARCHALGMALARAIDASAQDLRVAVVASGGLSHFVVDEDIDRRVIDALADGRHERLRELPRAALVSGSSEILNWVVAAAAAHALPLRWAEYQPLYRTPAGTGVGTAFAVWGG